MRPALLVIAAVLPAFSAAAAPSPSPEPALEQAGEEHASAAPAMGDRARFLLSQDRFHQDSEVLWPGFLSGLRGFEHFHFPVGNPIYFEPPTNESHVRLLYLHHNFADGSQLQGGDLDVIAAQARLALTERLSLIATKDGYSWLDTGLLGEDEGVNDLAAGLKYTFYVDREADLLMAAGARYQIKSGDSEILQGNVKELSPFFSIAKGFDRLHLVASVTDRIPLDSDDGNNILQWDLHLDYDIAPDVLPGFAPFIELHGLHYLSDGDRLPLSVGGVDYANLGSSDVSGSTVIWAGIGARWELSPHASLGFAYEHALTNRNADIFEDRITIDFILRW